jgi:hypothetical protein
MSVIQLPLISEPGKSILRFLTVAIWTVPEASETTGCSRLAIVI